LPKGAGEQSKKPGQRTALQKKKTGQGFARVGVAKKRGGPN